MRSTQFHERVNPGSFARPLVEHHDCTDFQTYPPHLYYKIHETKDTGQYTLWPLRGTWICGDPEWVRSPNPGPECAGERFLTGGPCSSHRVDSLTNPLQSINFHLKWPRPLPRRPPRSPRQPPVARRSPASPALRLTGEICFLCPFVVRSLVGTTDKTLSQEISHSCNHPRRRISPYSQFLYLQGAQAGPPRCVNVVWRERLTEPQSPTLVSVVVPLCVPPGTARAPTRVSPTVTFILAHSTLFPFPPLVPPLACRDWHLQEGHVRHELLHQRHLREGRDGGRPPLPLQQEVYPLLPRGPDCRPPRPPRRARQARRL
jgi:hypothetical protein